MTGRREFLAGTVAGAAVLAVAGPAGTAQPDDRDLVAAYARLQAIAAELAALDEPEEDPDPVLVEALSGRWMAAWYHAVGLPAHTPVGLAIKLRLAVDELKRISDARVDALITSALADALRWG